MTSGLANMGIVLALIVIGLATILRKENYQAQKTLPVLIIVALLVNFAPVFLGVIVDASNILMNLFLSTEEGGTLDFAKISNSFSEEIKMIGTDLGEAASLQAQTALLGKILVSVSFSLIAGFIFFLFAALFVFRYIAIWIAVIMSPLAFVAYILPKTRVFFDMWWKQFLSWCFIGVIAAFFIYLGAHMIASINIEDYVQKTTDARIDSKIGTGNDDWGLLNELLPYGVVSGFLVIGFFLSVSVSAMGASTIVNLTKKGGKGAMWGGKGLARQSVGRALNSSWGKKASRWMARRQIGRVRDAKTTLGKVGMAAGKLLTPLGYAKRKAGAAAINYAAGIGDNINEDKEKIKKRFGSDHEAMAAYVSSLSATNYTGKMAGAQALAEIKGGKGLDALPETDLRSIIRQTDRYDPKKLKNLIKHKPELIKDVQLGELIQNNLVNEKDIIEQMKGGMDMATAKVKATYKEAAKALKSTDIENLGDKTLNDKDIQEALGKYASNSILKEIGETKGGNHLANIQKAIQDRVGIEEAARTNPSFLRMAYTPGGQAYLNEWKTPGGKIIKTKEEMDEFIRKSSLSQEEETKRETNAIKKYQETLKKGGAPRGRRAPGSSQGRKSNNDNTPRGRRS